MDEYYVLHFYQVKRTIKYFSIKYIKYIMYTWFYFVNVPCVTKPLAKC
jgi:hypothetical protein